jgi:carboxyl-terminal processing protease
MSKIFKNSKIRTTIISLAFVVLFISGFVAAKLWAQRANNLMQYFQRFDAILKIVSTDYVEQLDMDKLMKAAINGMLDALDPYSNYLEADEYNNLKTTLEGQFGGIGIYIGTREGFPSVISPIEGTPAYRVGLKAGDKIIKIEKKSTEGMTIQDAMKLLRGTPGTKVNISCQREGINKPLDFTIVRDTIKIKAVPFAGKVAPDIGYVRLADFSRESRNELETAIDSLFNKVGVKKLIFDMRSNPGGYLQEGYEISDLFLSPGKLVVVAKGRTEESKREYVSIEQDKHGDYPLIVLVDRGSASAAEIVTGALQDWERAFVLGDTTFGKGSVQNIIQLDSTAALKLTNAYWYTPSGRCINRPNQGLAVIHDSSNAKKKYYTLGPQKRDIYGGGGIAPDYFMQYRRLNDLEVKLVSSGIFFDFAVKYTAYHKKIQPDFQVDDAMIQEFKKMMQDKKIDYTDAKFDSNSQYIKQEIEREISATLWGMNADYQIRVKNDEQIQKAIELLQPATITTTADIFSEVKPK